MNRLADAVYTVDPLGPATHALVMRYHQAWQARDLDALMALYHPQVEYNDFFQNRRIDPQALRDYLAASMPAGREALQTYTDRLRVDGDTALLQYQVTLRGGSGLVSFRACEALTVRDGLIWRVNEYASLVREPAGASTRVEGGRLALSRLGLSARQLGMLADDLQQYFLQSRPYLDPHLDLQQVAVATGYTRNQISFFLNQVLGQTFYRYLNQLRLDHLLAGLRPGDAARPVEELAQVAGFKSLSTFYRCFHERTGTSPKAYLECLEL